MSTQRSIYTGPIEVASKMAVLGVTEEALLEAVLHGEAERATCTENDVGPMAGLKQWNGTIRRLREVLVTSGWTRDRADHVESALREDGCVAITASVGDDITGDASGTPRTKHPRGNAVIRHIINNNTQLRLGFDAYATSGASSPRMIWILLFHTTDEETLCELSLPRSVDRHGRVNSWAERIILEPIVHAPEPQPGNREIDTEEDIEIPIERRVQ